MVDDERQQESGSDGTGVETSRRSDKSYRPYREREIDRYRKPNRAFEAEAGDQEKAGEDRAHNCADRVPCINTRRSCARLPLIPD